MPPNVTDEQLRSTLKLGTEQAASQLGVSQSQLAGLRRRIFPGQVTTDEGKFDEAIQREFDIRSNLPTEGTGRLATTFFSGGRNIFAPEGKQFELFGGGGVRVVDARDLTPEEEEIDRTREFTGLFDEPTEGREFKEEDITVAAAPGKTVARTGQTVKNPLTGVDVHAGPGEILIEYTDGTVERRKVSDIGTPGETTPIGEFGPSAEELGITKETEIKGGAGPEVTRAPQTQTVDQLVKEGAGPQQIEDRISAEQLAPTSSLTLIGKEYTSDEGKKRTAKDGHLFYRADDGTVLERPMSLAKFAKVPVDETRAEGFSGTMQSALSQALGRQADLGALYSNFQTDPIPTAGDLWKEFMERDGVKEGRDLQDSYIKELDEVKAKFDDKEDEINNNPWISEGSRIKQLRSNDEKRAKEESRLTQKIQLLQSIDETRMAHARWLIDRTISDAEAERSFQQGQLEFAIKRADDEINSLRKLQVDQAKIEQSRFEFEATFEQKAAQFDVKTQVDLAKLEQSNIKSVQGGLFDLSTGQFIVAPRSRSGPSVSADITRSTANKYLLPSGTTQEEFDNVVELARFVKSRGGSIDNAIQTLQGAGIPSSTWERVVADVFSGSTVEGTTSNESFEYGDY